MKRKQIVWWWVVAITMGLTGTVVWPTSAAIVPNVRQEEATVVFASATPASAAQQEVQLSAALYLPLIQSARVPGGADQGNYTLQTTVTGQGRIIVSPPQSLFAAGQTVTLSVIASPGWQFSGWHGDLSGRDNPVIMQMNRNYAITADFVEPSTDPTATVSPAPTNTPVPTPNNTPTFTNTPVPPPTFTNTLVPPLTFTNTPVPPPTFTNTPIPPPTFTNTPVLPPTFTNTPVPPPTFTNTPVPPPTFTNTPVPPPTFTNTPVPPPTFTNTPVPPPTFTNTPVPPPTFTNTPVPPPNQPPVVNAGSSQTITWPAMATLNGSVSDDGLPNGQLTILWQKVTGPGTVAFTAAEQPVTTASFSAPGDYILILIADDGALNNHALVAIQVNGTVLAAPSNVQVTALDATTLSITWTDNADNEEGFTIDEGSTAFDLGAGSVAFTHGGLAPNSYHCYSLSAFNAYGRSAATDWVCATTPPLPVQVESLNVRVQFEQRDAGVGRQQDVPFQVTIKDAPGTQTLYQTSGWVYPLSIPAGNYGTATLLPSNPTLVYGQTYQIFVRGAMHLTRRITLTLTEGMRLDLTDPSVNPNGALWGCDLNQDNQVNQADVDIVIATIQAGHQPPVSPEPNSAIYRSNINGDQFINISDIAVCSANFGKVGDS
jgi:hypothetical protein